MGSTGHASQRERCSGRDTSLACAVLRGVTHRTSRRFILHSASVRLASLFDHGQSSRSFAADCAGGAQDGFAGRLATMTQSRMNCLNSGAGATVFSSSFWLISRLRMGGYTNRLGSARRMPGGWGMGLFHGVLPLNGDAMVRDKHPQMDQPISQSRSVECPGAFTPITLEPTRTRRRTRPGGWRGAGCSAACAAGWRCIGPR